MCAERNRQIYCRWRGGEQILTIIHRRINANPPFCTPYNSSVMSKICFIQQFHNKRINLRKSSAVFWSREDEYVCHFINAPLTHIVTYFDRKEELYPVTVIRSLHPARKHVGKINRLTARGTSAGVPKEFLKGFPAEKSALSTPSPSPPRSSVIP